MENTSFNMIWGHSTCPSDNSQQESMLDEPAPTLDKGSQTNFYYKCTTDEDTHFECFPMKNQNNDEDEFLKTLEVVPWFDDQAELSDKTKDKHSINNSTQVFISRGIYKHPSRKWEKVPKKTRHKNEPDLSNPCFLEPLLQGWTRELVYRKTSRHIDIYYLTPSRERVRSRRQLELKLKNTGLSIENFSFFKKSMELDDPKMEIIRDAKTPGKLHEKKSALKITASTSDKQKTPNKGKKASVPKSLTIDIVSSKNGQRDNPGNGKLHEKKSALKITASTSDMQKTPAKGKKASMPKSLTIDIVSSKNGQRDNPGNGKRVFMPNKSLKIDIVGSENDQRDNSAIYEILSEASEVLINLASRAGADDFTFCREPIGLNDPEKEIICAASNKLRASENSVPITLVEKTEDEYSAKNSSPQIEESLNGMNRTLRRNKKSQIKESLTGMKDTIRSKKSQKPKDTSKINIVGSKSDQGDKSVNNETLNEQSDFLMSPAFRDRRRKAPPDLSSPRHMDTICKPIPNLSKYIKPFKEGWRRELVYRRMNGIRNKNSKTRDVYYYSPAGKKIRSMKQLVLNLSKTGLSADNFTFAAEPMGLNDPDKEIIRNAKMRAPVNSVPKIAVTEVKKHKLRKRRKPKVNNKKNKINTIPKHSKSSKKVKSVNLKLNKILKEASENLMELGPLDKNQKDPLEVSSICHLQQLSGSTRRRTLTEKEPTPSTSGLTFGNRKRTLMPNKTSKLNEEPTPSTSGLISGKSKRSSVSNNKFKLDAVAGPSKIKITENGQTVISDIQEILKETSKSFMRLRSSLSKEEPTPSTSGFTFGKGKRTPVPNKRYILNGSSKSKIPKKGRPVNSDLKASKSFRKLKSSLPKSRKYRNRPDFTNPCFLKPFEQGWKREVVYRARGSVVHSDVYYIPPSGKKIRSTRELDPVLSNTGLSSENFSFYRMPMGLNDDKKEIIRNAKLKNTPKKMAPGRPPKSSISVIGRALAARVRSSLDHR